MQHLYAHVSDACGCIWVGGSCMLSQQTATKLAQPFFIWAAALQTEPFGEIEKGSE